MAQKILYINPIKKSKRSLTKKRKPTVAKKAKSKRRIKRRIKHRKNPVVARANPIKRRKRRSVKRKNPIFKKRRQVLSPIKTRGIVDRVAIPAATAAAGAVALDFLWANLPIPLSAKAGNMRPVAKAIGAVVMVKVAEHFTDRKTAEAFGVGALSVIMYDLARGMIKKSMPSVKLGEYVGEYELGEYVGSGGGLDFDAPLDFYTSAGEGVNTVPSYPMVAAPAPVPAMAGGTPKVGEYIDGIDAIDDYYADDEYFYGD